MKPSEFCKRFQQWAEIMNKKEPKDSGPHSFFYLWHKINHFINKSCLLDRLIYQGEGISQTPCPVHKGVWQGVHFDWPGKVPANEVNPRLQEAYDAGCRCFLHKCGCTTGWNVDTHCGCIQTFATRTTKCWCTPNDCANQGEHGDVCCCKPTS